MIGKSKKTENNEAGVNYEVKVFGSVRTISEGAYSFNIEVNGIKIYSMVYREGVKDGKEWSLISFPSRKGNDGKYYSHCYFTITDEVKDSIVKQITELFEG